MFDRYNFFRSIAKPVRDIGMENDLESNSPIGPVEMPSPAGVEPLLPKPKSILERFREIQSNRPIYNRLVDTMENSPNRADYRPNKVTGLASILGGVAAGWRNPGEGVRVARDIAENPFNQAREDYDARLANLRALAGMEGQDIQLQLQGLQSEIEDTRDTRNFDHRVKVDEANLEDKDLDRTEDMRQFDLGQFNMLGQKEADRSFQREQTNKENQEWARRNNLSFINDKELANLRAGHESRHINQRNQGDLAVANARGDAQIKAIQERVKAQNERLKLVAQNNPSNQVKQGLANAMALSAATNIELDGILSISESGVPVVAADSSSDDAILRDFKKRLREGFIKPVPGPLPPGGADPLGIRGGGN